MKTWLAAMGGIWLLTSAAPAADDNIRLAFPNAPVADLLAYYGNLTGKKVVHDNTVSGQVDLVTTGPVDREKASELIERALSLNGFTLVDTSEDVVSVIGLGKSARTTEMRNYRKLEELPRGHLLCTYLCKPKHRGALEVAGFLAQYAPASNNVSFFADPKSGTVVMTAPAGMIRSLLRVIDSLDVEEPAAEAAVKARPTLQSSETPRPETPVIQHPSPESKPVGPGGN